MNTQQLIFVAVLAFSIAFISCCDILASTPLNVRTTNLRGTQFTVSWVSAKEEIGRIKYGTNVGDYVNWPVAGDDRGDETIDDVHHVTLVGLTPSTSYYYEIISGDTSENNGGAFFQVNPGPEIAPGSSSCQPAGRIYIDQALTQPAYNTIAYITIIEGSEDQASATESMIVADVGENIGYWFIEISNFRINDLSALYNYNCGVDVILVEAEGGRNGSAQMTTLAVDWDIDDPGTERPAFYLTAQGDIDDNDVIDLTDAILVLQLVVGVLPASEMHNGADVNGDTKIGLAEAIYVMKEIAQIN